MRLVIIIAWSRPVLRTASTSSAHPPGWRATWPSPCTRTCVGARTLHL